MTYYFPGENYSYSYCFCKCTVIKTWTVIIGPVKKTKMTYLTLFRLDC